MPTFNPSAIVEDVDGKPMKAGLVDDPKVRATMTELRGAHAKALKDAPEKAPAIEEELHALISDNQRDLTLGEVVVAALRSPLKGDEELSEVTKLDHMEWAIKVRAAQNALESVTFDNGQMERIRARVNRCYPQPEVIYRLKQSIKSDVPVEVPKAA